MDNARQSRLDQEALIGALFATHTPAGLDAAGLAIYRRNLAAAAARSISITFPTLACLIGADRLAVFARDYLLTRGRQVFDWGLWGEGFPDWLENQVMSEAHPYLADCARLDWCIHLSERAEDPRPDLASFSALQGLESHDYSLQFATGLYVLNSIYPIVEIYEAHRKEPAKPNLGAAIRLLQQGQGQAALVWRQGLSTKVRETVPGEQHWLQLARRPGLKVSDIIEQSTPKQLPLEKWLNTSIQEQLVIGLRLPFSKT